MGRSLRPEDGDSFGFGISLYQAAAAAAPHRATHELLGLVPTLVSLAQADEPGHPTGVAGQPRSPGSFEDFDLLVEQLARLPREVPADLQRRVQNRSQPRVGSNPAAHNGALLGDSAL